MCQLISGGGDTERFTVAEIRSNASGDNTSGCAVRAEPVHVKRRMERERCTVSYLRQRVISAGKICIIVLMFDVTQAIFCKRVPIW